MKLDLVAFTQGGASLAKRLEQALRAAGDEARACAADSVAQAAGLPPAGPLHAWTERAFSRADGLIFIGASGIAVRAVAPFVRDKFQDPAVVSVDEAGRFVVPLLSGHVGGANRLAERVAVLTGGVACVSTATDVRGVFAVDRWAVEQGLVIDGREAAKRISAALLAGETVGFASDFPVSGELPPGVVQGPAETGFFVTLREKGAQPFPHTLYLRPKIVTLGLGCRRGTPETAIAAAVTAALETENLSPLCVARAATIDLKADEAGLLAYCAAHSLPLRTYPAARLRDVEGTFSPSAFVERTTGVDNVCERAAVADGGTLVIRKRAGGGVTVAAAAGDYTVRFDGWETDARPRRSPQ